MIQRTLSVLLERVGDRVLRLRSWKYRTVTFLMLIALAIALIAARRWFTVSISDWQIVGILLAGAVLARLLRPVVVRRDSLVETARKIEETHPDLDAGLLAALEQQPAEAGGELRYLQQRVIRRAVAHSKSRRWSDVVPVGQLRRWMTAGLVSLVLLITCGVFGFERNERRVFGKADPFLSSSKSTVDGYGIAIEPGDHEIESGTSLLVLARFAGQMPTTARLDLTTSDGAQQFEMHQSLNDNMFAARVPSVTKSGVYSVQYDDEHTGEFRLRVFEFPALTRADAVITFPEYSGLQPTTVQDTRRVSVPQGSSIQFLFRLNKPVAAAELRDQDGKVVSLDATGEAVRSVVLTGDRSRRFKLHLTDDAGRTNKLPPEISVSVLPNRRPELKLAFPGRDRPVSPLEELAVEAKISDDFGLDAFGLIYGMAGKDPQTVTLGRDARGKVTHSAAHVMSLESMKAEPDQLVSYYFFADDRGPDGSVRRTFSDMYFAEVRKFEQIFRQAQQQAGQQQQNQQQQNQNQQGGQQGQKMDQLAKLQKQIINATWTLVRNNDAAADARFQADVNVLAESQETAMQKVLELAADLQKPEMQMAARNVTNHMQSAIDALKAVDGPGSARLHDAIRFEQAAYQELLRLRAQEIQVQRQRQQQQRQQQQGGQQGGNAGNRSQQQLNQLELDNKRNRYESQNQARQQQPANVNQEQLRTLNRLRELARRQEAINEKLKQLESELRQAKTQEEREEIERQLKRLRDDEQQMLRDIDETAERIAQQEQQNEDSARMQDQVRQARDRALKTSEALQKGAVSQALSEGTRTERDLKELRDDFRKQTASEFSDVMREMRNEAREIEEEQKQVARKLAENKKAKSLRYDQQRKEIQESLDDQAQRVSDLTNKMKQVVEQAEDTEPLLARSLYETARKLKDKPPEKDLEAAEFLVRRGFLDQAKQAERAARQGIERMREGVEKSAETVLGNELEGLQRAQEELEQLKRDLGDELARNDPDQADRLAQNDPRGRTRPQANGRGQQRSQRDDNQREPEQGQGDREQRERGENSARQGDSKGGRPGNREGGSDQNQRERNADRAANNAPGTNNRSNRNQQQNDAEPQQQGARSGSRPGGQQRPQDRADDQNQDRESRNRGARPGRPQDGPPQGLRNLSGINGGGPGGNRRFDPLTGDEYRDWNERLRDVEEMIEDPELRSDVSRIRDRARAMRVDLKRHAKKPQWELVRTRLIEPMVELQKRINEEIAKRRDDDSLVPIDRDPVPTRYADMVRKYYEQLGRGGPDEPVQER